MVIHDEQHSASTARRWEDTNEQSLLLEEKKKINLQNLPLYFGCIPIPFATYMDVIVNEKLILLNNIPSQYLRNFFLGGGEDFLRRCNWDIDVLNFIY